MIVAVANRKGGTGKTTTAVNLAAEWAAAGHPTLLIDLDTQGHASLGVGCGDRLRPGYGVHRVLHEEGYPLEQDLLETGMADLCLLPPDPGDEGASAEVEPARLCHALQRAGLTERFRRIVLDTPPTQDAVLFNALGTANGVLAPFVPHHLAGEAVRRLAALFYRAATRDNSRLRHFGLLPVMVDTRIRLHRRVLEGLRRQFGRDRMFRGIRNNIRLAEAFEQGCPIRLHAPRSSGAMDYCLLAGEIESQWTVDAVSNVN